jgi:hypothetical protein
MMIFHKVMIFRFMILTEPIAKPAYPVTPAKAGVQNALKRLDSGFRRNDAEGLLQLAQRNKID